MDFIQRLKLNKNKDIGAIADIYMAEKEDEIRIACNVNQWDI